MNEKHISRMLPMTEKGIYLLELIMSIEKSLLYPVHSLKNKDFI
jgi:hypothetical protein